MLVAGHFFIVVRVPAASLIHVNAPGHLRTIVVYVTSAPPGRVGNTWQRMFLQIAATAPLYDQLDAMRRQLGDLLDRARVGVRESPYRAVCDERGFVLRDYSRAGTGPALLLVPAPIKAPYIWDLTQQGSVVRRFLAAGFQVLAVEWRAPTRDTADTDLAAYAETMLSQCVESCCRTARQPRIFLLAIRSAERSAPSMRACIPSVCTASCCWARRSISARR
jgi:hypothetical protein